MTEFEMEIWYNQTMLKFTTCAYISIYQYSIDNVYRYSNNIGKHIHQHLWSINP
jgi:hypothetical protein